MFQFLANYKPETLVLPRGVWVPEVERNQRLGLPLEKGQKTTAGTRTICGNCLYLSATKNRQIREKLLCTIYVQVVSAVLFELFTFSYLKMDSEVKS